MNLYFYFIPVDGALAGGFSGRFPFKSVSPLIFVRQERTGPVWSLVTQFDFRQTQTARRYHNAPGAQRRSVVNMSLIDSQPPTRGGEVMLNVLRCQLTY